MLPPLTRVRARYAGSGHLLYDTWQPIRDLIDIEDGRRAVREHGSFALLDGRVAHLLTVGELIPLQKV